jgi:hypothetical protein
MGEQSRLEEVTVSALRLDDAELVAVGLACARAAEWMTSRPAALFLREIARQCGALGMWRDLYLEHMDLLLADDDPPEPTRTTGGDPRLWRPTGTGWPG